MRLVMFDVDGTLVQWNDIDRICYSVAVREALGICQIDTDWSHYAHVTDSGITSEIIEKYLSRKPEQSDLHAVRTAYLRRLQHEVGENSACFQPVPGAFELIKALCSEDSIGVCLATGGWRAAAMLKLQTAGIPVENIPLASADDSHERVGIMIQALEQAMVQRDRRLFDSVTYIGDAVWDFNNSQKLGWHFVGIGTGNNAEDLKQAGVTHVIQDFLDKDFFFRILGIAREIEMR